MKLQAKYEVEFVQDGIKIPACFPGTFNKNYSPVQLLQLSYKFYPEPYYEIN